MFKQEQHYNTGAPTYRQPLLQAMKVFLMAPFFRRPQNSEKNAGPGPLPYSRPF
jgi:hypothetical protein